MVGCVKSGDGRVQSDICFRDVRAEEERSAMACGWIAQVCFYSVEGFKQWIHIRIVRFLTCCKTAFIHAVVDGIVNPIIHFVNLGPEMFRIESFALLVSFTIHWFDQIVKFCIQHPDNLRRLVVDDGLGLLVP